MIDTSLVPGGFNGSPGDTSHTGWWKWQAPECGDVEVNTCGSLYDTVLWVGTAHDTAATIVSADDNASGMYCDGFYKPEDAWSANLETVGFSANKGITYFIMIGAYDKSTVETTTQINLIYDCQICTPRPEVIALSGCPISTVEGNTAVISAYRIDLDNIYNGQVSVEYTTFDLTASGGDACAVCDSENETCIHYVSSTGTLTWAHGDSAMKTVSIDTCDTNVPVIKTFTFVIHSCQTSEEILTFPESCEIQNGICTVSILPAASNQLEFEDNLDNLLLESGTERLVLEEAP
jgi:hypothetical protein